MLLFDMTYATRESARHALARREARGDAADRVRGALHSALACLDRVEPTGTVRALRDSAERLRAEVDAWEQALPSVDRREGAMRRAMSIQLAAVALSRQVAR